MKKTDLRQLIRETILESEYLNEAYPIQCCNAQGQLGNYTVPSASDTCADIQLTSPPCTGIVDPVDLEPIDDFDDNDDNPTSTTPCDQSFGTCATQHDLQGNFVNNNPTNFINNMETKYNTGGCITLEKIRDRHQRHLNTGIYVGQNHPQGKQMGPKWITQKTSKVNFLNCIISGPCCVNTTGGGDGDSPDDGDNVAENLYESKVLRKLVKNSMKDFIND